ncbi:hypothetical protein I5Q34_29820 [Streptomyces sp. AV19]|uniref:hypothetical protein n=1 Tax=Streptomyces sp. AV19 TaxID=2793068 RepID=UPI0018FE365D|nr:hypothetical protein [Streptomyces sp. AV19]MBH1938406.1 hypothetical protein [Streptomyces sp. AV19]MDG4535055.1 hypothetical protein [Streptomyces sp. AV19]
MTEQPWDRIVTEAREQTGYTGPIPGRTVAAIESALAEERHAAYRAELSRLGDGPGFEAFLDHWWVQAIADSADEDVREVAVDCADIAIALHVKAHPGPTYTTAEVAAKLAEDAA